MQRVHYRHNEDCLTVYACLAMILSAFALVPRLFRWLLLLCVSQSLWAISCWHPDIPGWFQICAIGFEFTHVKIHLAPAWRPKDFLSSALSQDAMLPDTACCHPLLCNTVLSCLPMSSHTLIFSRLFTFTYLPWVLGYLCENFKYFLAFMCCKILFHRKIIKSREWLWL